MSFGQGNILTLPPTNEKVTVPPYLRKKLSNRLVSFRVIPYNKTVSRFLAESVTHLI